MEDQNVYETPKAEGLELGKFESFGGWLRFYQVINYISAIIIFLMALMVSVFVVLDEYAEGELFEAMVAFVELIPDLAIAIMILQVIKIKDRDVPNKIVKYLGYYLAASFAVYGFVYYLYRTDVIVDKPISIWSSIIYYWIWTSYMKKSKRVKAYYGDNAVG